MVKMYIALHPQANVDRLYLPKNKGERGMISVKDRNPEEGNRGNAYDCTRPSTENRKEQLKLKVFHPYVDCVEKKRKQSTMLIVIIKCWHITLKKH